MDVLRERGQRVKGILIEKNGGEEYTEIDMEREREWDQDKNTSMREIHRKREIEREN